MNSTWATIKGGDDDMYHEAGGSSTFVGVVLGVTLGIVTAVTITGNGLVLVAIYTNRHLRGTTHYFIANLAVADLLLGVIVLPFSVSLEVSFR